MADFLPRPLPFVTAALPGLAGAVKVLPEDFEVEEIPEVEPSGAGEHLYLWIEKRGRDTPEVAAELARAFAVDPRDVGYAGLKDRQAVARQWFSLPAKAPAPVALEGVRVLETARHVQKLRVGMLRGNRFRIRLRGSADVAGATRVLEMLRASGVPNWFGPQRFGRRGDNAQLGAALIGAGEHPLLRRAERDRFLRKLALSALQSELFNRLLASRVIEGRLAALEPGDVVEVPEDDRPLVARDVSLAARVMAFEAAVTGPMFGSKMLAAEGTPGLREAAALADLGLTPETLARGGRELRGARRAYRIQLERVDLRADDGNLSLSFDLPAGAYATSILRELTRGTASAPEPE